MILKPGDLHGNVSHSAVNRFGETQASANTGCGQIHSPLFFLRMREDKGHHESLDNNGITVEPQLLFILFSF